ncbi:hypothetical protein [Salinilacihabitans rarus]|uniref:hypothetical protein n=1 Tax=Salinilacihabitans rarus TaxID=2961596 RepID=UPI0020C8F767|nr:hypothetical protein [Salinilacihabitans rarus]
MDVEPTPGDVLTALRIALVAVQLGILGLAFDRVPLVIAGAFVSLIALLPIERLSAGRRARAGERDS